MQKKYLLPSIQREFVWGTDQIEKLFDSLMREYHQKDGKHNPKANTNGTEEVMAILDGQQRMTSLYIALKGTHAYNLSYKRWDNPLAYPNVGLDFTNFEEFLDEREKLLMEKLKMELM